MTGLDRIASLVLCMAGCFNVPSPFPDRCGPEGIILPRVTRADPTAGAFRGLIETCISPRLDTPLVRAC